MEITLLRTTRSAESTIGELYINGVFQCYTLEDVERDTKVWGKTAIPKGTYEVVITMSARFKKELPLLVNVPNYSGVRIHAGNTAKDTEGCILLGKTKVLDFVGMSRQAMNEFMPKLRQGLSKGKVMITIK